MDPTSKGRQYYQEKSYEKALQAFDRAVMFSSDNLLLTALDHRAATYEKLGKLQAALKDAKEMIELKPGLAKGYLRCAKVLLLKREDSLAQKLYERGLEKVKIGTDPDRVLLQSMHSKLIKKQEPKPCFDPLGKLPPELAEMVCRQLDVRDLVVSLAVSKSWKKFLEAFHDLWTSIDLRRARKVVNQTSLKSYLRRSSFGLLEAYLTIKATDSQSQDRLQYITSHCPNLVSLGLCQGHIGVSLAESIPRVEKLRSLVLESCTIQLNHVVQVLTLCPQLEIAKFDEISCPRRSITLRWPQMNNLRELRLVASDRVQSAEDLGDFETLSQTCPNLRSVTFRKWLIHTDDFFSWNALESLDLLETKWTWAPLVQQSLKLLNISSTRAIGHQARDFATHTHLPILETFNCTGTAGLDVSDIFNLVEPSIQAGTLRGLKMGFRYLGPPIPIPRWERLTVPSTVQYLSLTGLRYSEIGLLSILEWFPNLRRVNLTKTLVTGVTIRALEDREHGPLEWLCLHHCHEVSPDAVEYARAKGTIVEMSLTVESSSWREAFGLGRQ